VITTDEQNSSQKDRSRPGVLNEEILQLMLTGEAAVTARQLREMAERTIHPKS